MTWGDAVIIILWAMGVLVLLGLGRKLEVKLDAILKLFADTARPKLTGNPASVRTEPNPPEERTVFHLTAEHDAKVLGEDDLE
jgi:hypothetical protein